jgi:hypothetical protein
MLVPNFGTGNAEVEAFAPVQTLQESTSYPSC